MPENLFTAVHKETRAAWNIRKEISVIPRRGVGLTSGPEPVDSARPVAPEDGTGVKDKSFGIRFPLTREVVISKQHSAVFTNQAFSFSPGGKEDLKWSMITRKPPLL